MLDKLCRLTVQQKNKSINPLHYLYTYSLFRKRAYDDAVEKKRALTHVRDGIGEHGSESSLLTGGAIEFERKKHYT
jgi:hypothetical protein